MKKNLMESLREHYADLTSSASELRKEIVQRAMAGKPADVEEIASQLEALGWSVDDLEVAVRYVSTYDECVSAGITGLNAPDLDAPRAILESGATVCRNALAWHRAAEQLPKIRAAMAAIDKAQEKDVEELERLRSQFADRSTKRQEEMNALGTRFNAASEAHGELERLIAKQAQPGDVQQAKVGSDKARLTMAIAEQNRRERLNRLEAQQKDGAKDGQTRLSQEQIADQVRRQDKAYEDAKRRGAAFPGMGSLSESVTSDA